MLLCTAGMLNICWIIQQKLATLLKNRPIVKWYPLKKVLFLSKNNFMLLLLQQTKDTYFILSFSKFQLVILLGITLNLLLSAVCNTEINSLECSFNFLYMGINSVKPSKLSFNFHLNTHLTTTCFLEQNILGSVFLSPFLNPWFRWKGKMLIKWHYASLSSQQTL